MRKILSAVLVLVMMVTLMVPSAMAAEPEEEKTPTESVSMDANGGGFTNQLLSADQPEAETVEKDSNPVANIIVFAVLVAVVGVSVALIIDKKKKLYK